MVAAHALETTPLIPLLLRRPELFRLTSPAIHPHQNTPLILLSTPHPHTSADNTQPSLFPILLCTLLQERERESERLRSGSRPPFLGGAAMPESSKKQRTPATRKLQLSECDGSDE
ncbi:hypothetical protein Hdeb2414_s0004g00150331 [Helianthus debilis subsp. tardiflorus]